MNDSEKTRIFNIIQKEVSLDPATLDPEGDLREQISIDSMQFVTIIARLEKEFEIEIPISVMEAATLNEFLEIVEKELWMKAS